LCFDKGVIKFKDNRIIHNASTTFGSSGSPLIKRYQHNLIIGIHNGYYSGYNLATPLDIIINDIQNKINNKKNNNVIIEYKNKINLIYEKNIIKKNVIFYLVKILLKIIKIILN